jgi:hypothetical protein
VVRIYRSTAAGLLELFLAQPVDLLCHEALQNLAPADLLPYRTTCFSTTTTDTFTTAPPPNPEGPAAAYSTTIGNSSVFTTPGDLTYHGSTAKGERTQRTRASRFPPFGPGSPSDFNTEP